MAGQPAAGIHCRQGGQQAAAAPIESLTLGAGAHQTAAYILWGILFFNVAAGIAILSNLKPMALKNLGVSEMLAASVVMVGSFFNGFGRVFWGALSEKAGTPQTCSC